MNDYDLRCCICDARARSRTELAEHERACRLRDDPTWDEEPAKEAAE